MQWKRYMKTNFYVRKYLHIVLGWKILHLGVFLTVSHLSDRTSHKNFNNTIHHQAGHYLPWFITVFCYVNLRPPFDSPWMQLSNKRFLHLCCFRNKWPLAMALFTLSMGLNAAKSPPSAHNGLFCNDLELWNVSCNNLSLLPRSIDFLSKRLTT